LILKKSQGREVIVGIRPGDLRLTDTDAENTVSARVEVIEALGNETIIYTNLDMDSDVEIEKSPFSITVSARLKKNPAKRSEIILAMDEDAIHIFDRETGVSLKN
jgi:multiple sugar transport system ATP-binding protein